MIVQDAEIVGKWDILQEIVPNLLIIAAYVTPMDIGQSRVEVD